MSPKIPKLSRGACPQTSLGGRSAAYTLFTAIPVGWPYQSRKAASGPEFAVGGDVDTRPSRHHTASLTLAPQCYAFAYIYSSYLNVEVRDAGSHCIFAACAVVLARCWPHSQASRRYGTERLDQPAAHSDHVRNRSDISTERPRWNAGAASWRLHRAHTAKPQMTLRKLISILCSLKYRWIERFAGITAY